MIGLGLDKLKPTVKDVCTFCGLKFPTRKEQNEAVLNGNKWIHATCAAKDLFKRPAGLANA